MGQSGIGDKIWMVLGCAGWVAGLLLAGSDNPFMPWPNIAGLVLFFISSLGLSASLEKLDSMEKLDRKRRSTMPALGGSISGEKREDLWQPEELGSVLRGLNHAMGVLLKS